MKVAPRNASQGQTNYLAGLGAEDIVSRFYERQGSSVIQHRFRGKRGEIDIVVQDGPTIVFVEVKRSTTHAGGALRVTTDKIHRLRAIAEEYIGRMSTGLLTDMRFDVALVDEQGRIQIHENALMA